MTAHPPTRRILLHRTAGPYIGVKMRRTRIEHILSALPPLATEERTFGIGSSVPLADICSAANCTLFDHFVRAARPAYSSLNCGAGETIERRRPRQQRAQRRSQCS